MERKTKVGIMCQYALIPDVPDGVKDYSLGLAKILRQKGLETVLFGPYVGDGLQNEADETIGRRLIQLGKKTLGNTGYKMTVTINVPKAKNILERQKLDALDVEEPWASPPTFLTTIVARYIIREEDRPSVIVNHHSHTERLTPFQKGLEIAGGRTGFARWIYENNVDERGGVSPATNLLWAGLIGEDVDLYEVIPNGIDVDKFANEKRDFRDWNELKKQGKKIILALGRHDKRKGFDVLIKALGKLIKEGERRDLFLKLTGEDHETENLKKLVQTLGLSEYVEFLGILPEEDLVKAVKNCNLLAAPSIGEEGTNRSILNGRAAGIPVCATRIGGQTFAYGDETIFGQMAEPSNVDSLAENISNLLGLPKEEVDRRAEKGLVYVREVFSWDSVGNKKIRQIERAIERRKNTLAKSGTVYRR